MKALAFSPAAEADIRSIWLYSASNWGPDQADRYTDDIRDISRALVSGRRRGRVVAARRGYLKCPSGAHVIYYRDLGDRLEIVRVLHARQDAERILSD